MARPEKVAEVDEVRAHLSGAAATLLTHYRGLSVTEMAELRASLRGANAQMRIVKNTLARRAADAAGIAEIKDLLSGPTGMVFCAEDPVAPAKAIKAFQKDHPELVVRGGYLEGEVLSDAEAMALAELDSREELLAKLAGLMEGALSNTARLLQAATEKQARLMQALLDAGGPPGAEAGEPEAQAAEEAAGEPADEVAASDDAADDAAEAAEAPEAAAEEAQAAESASDGAAQDEAASEDPEQA